MPAAVRSARLPDIDSIQRIASHAWHRAHAPIIGTETADDFLDEFYDSASIEERVHRDDMDLLVAIDAEEVVGFGLIVPAQDRSEVSLVNQLYVEPSRWGNGIGQRLLDAMESRALADGATRIELSVMVGNEQAIGFYEAAGYTHVETEYDDRIDTEARRYAKDLDTDAE